MKPSGPLPSRIMLVDECFRKADKENGRPFSGYIGQELGKLLSLTGIRLDNCYSTWAVKQYSPDGGESFFAHKKKDVTELHTDLNGKPALGFVHDGLEELLQEIESCQPNVILCFGNTAMFVLTGKWGIQNYRGSTLTSCLNTSYPVKVIPCYPMGRVMWKEQLKPIMQQDLRRVVKASQNRELIPMDYKFVIRPNFGTALSVLENLTKLVLKGPLKLGVDIETRSYHIACIQLAWTTSHAICIPLMCTERKEGYWTLDEESVLMYKLYKLLTHVNCLVIGQNFQYDAQYIIRYLMFCPNLTRDTMTAQHSMFSTMEKGLDFLSSMYCEHHTYWKSEGKEWTAEMDEDQLWEYGCKDAVITYEVDTAQQSAIQKMGLQEVDDFQQKLWWPVLKAILLGVKVDIKERARLAGVLFEEIQAREVWMYEVLGRMVNIKSPQQMAELFFDDLGQKRVMKRRKGNKFTPTTDDEALRFIELREPLLKPLCRKISEMRSLGVFLSTFIKAPLDIDGRMRCTYQIPGAETYRFKSKKNAFGTGTNLQNIPEGGTEEELELPNIKKLFIPDDGKEDFDIDLDSADLRIVCWESDCVEMKAMINEGKKVYVEVAKEYYNDPTITKKHSCYRTFKSLCHGTNYLGTAKGLANRLGLSVHETEKLQKWYYGKFPEIQNWQEDIKNQVYSRRMVKNIFGYRYYIFEKLEGTIMNQVIAWIPQSTVACLINRIWMNIDQNLPEVEIKMQVHDSLVGQYDVKKADWCKKRITEEGMIELPYPDPMIIPTGIKCSSVSLGDCR